MYDVVVLHFRQRSWCGLLGSQYKAESALQMKWLNDPLS
jgi:hypothetical protein